jgi:replicative DNA helicase
VGQAAGRESGSLQRVNEILSQQGLPANLEAEKALLGALLLNNTLFEEVQGTLEPADFALPAHQRVFKSLVELRSQNEPLDLVTVTERLHHKGELEAVGGAEYVGELVSGIPRLTSAAHYAKIIKDRSLLRQLIQRASQIIAQAYSSSEEPGVVLAQAEQAILEVGDQTLRSTLMGLSELAPHATATLEGLILRGQNVTGISTKFPYLDATTSGLQRSDFIILAARPSVGKTAFALTTALNVARQGQTVAFFSLEMSSEQVFFRLLSMFSGMDLQQLRTGRIPRSRQAEVALKIDQMSALPIYIDDSPVLTMLDIGAKLRRLATKQPVDLVVIDYIGLVKPLGKSENRNQEVAGISRGLKALAKELKVPVVALSQLSRAPEKRGEGKEPLLSDLRDSGSLEQDADLVLFLHRNVVARDEDADTRTRAKLIIAKQRNGPTGLVDLTFIESQAQFFESTGGGFGE